MIRVVQTSESVVLYGINFFLRKNNCSLRNRRLTRSRNEKTRIFQIWLMFGCYEIH